MITPLLPKINPQVIKRISPTQNEVNIHHLSTTPSEEGTMRLAWEGGGRGLKTYNKRPCVKEK